MFIRQTLSVKEVRRRHKTQVLVKVANTHPDIIIGIDIPVNYPSYFTGRRHSQYHPALLSLDEHIRPQRSTTFLQAVSIITLPK